MRCGDRRLKKRPRRRVPGPHGCQRSTRAFLEAQELPFPAQTLAEAAAVLGEELGDLVGRRAAPVALQLADVGDGGQRTCACLNHALDTALVSLVASAAGGVGDD